MKRLVARLISNNLTTMIALIPKVHIDLKQKKCRSIKVLITKQLIKRNVVSYT